MKNKLSIIIAHYYPNTTDYDNPLSKTLDTIDKDYNKNKNSKDCNLILKEGLKKYLKKKTI